VDRSGLNAFTKRQFNLFLDDIEGQKALGRIHVLHLSSPHGPFAFDEEGNALPSRGSYRQQSMFVDVLVGNLISKLKSEGIYDETVIFVTGDHGPRSFVPSPERPPDPVMPRVPLVIRAPGLNSDVSDVDYQHIDFGSTLTDILGLPPPNGAEGVSAFSQERPQRDKVFHRAPWTFIYSREDDSWHFSQTE
jgi:arylsulfatase A-like enzyme